MFVFRCFLGTSSIKGGIRRWNPRVCRGEEETSRLGMVPIQVGVGPE